RWLEPRTGRLRLGMAVRVGDVLVASYSESVQVGVVAYCIGPDWMAGVGAWPARKTLSSQTMVRRGKSLPASLASLPGVCPTCFSILVPVNFLAFRVRMAIFRPNSQVRRDRAIKKGGPTARLFYCRNGFARDPGPPIRNVAQVACWPSASPS